MSWFEQAKALKDSGMNYKQIATQLGLPYTTVHSRFYKLDKAEKVEQPIIDIEGIILDLLKRNSSISVDYAIEKIDNKDVPHTAVLEAVSSLQSKGYNIERNGSYFHLRKVASAREDQYYEEHWDGSQIIRFGVASDMHLGSKHQQLTHLNTMYDIFEREGITTVYNPGDITEGSGMRVGHQYEIFKHGADEQADYVIEAYPYRKGITTKFITGNHDHAHLKSGGIDIGRPIARERPDLEYLGMNHARIMLTPNCPMDMVHPLDGASYALSYHSQKAIEAMSQDDLPKIYITGHHHKSIYVYYRGIHCLEAGTFEAQTPWMKGKKLAAHVGGWIVTVHVDAEGHITRFIPEWIPFPKTIHHDY